MSFFNDDTPISPPLTPAQKEAKRVAEEKAKTFARRFVADAIGGVATESTPEPEPTKSNTAKLLEFVESDDFAKLIKGFVMLPALFLTQAVVNRALRRSAVKAYIRLQEQNFEVTQKSAKDYVTILNFLAFMAGISATNGHRAALGLKALGNSITTKEKSK